MLGVGSHDDAAALTPPVVLAADGEAPVEREHDLDRVVCMRGHHALSSGSEEEPAFPQVPARDAQPAIRLVIRLVSQARILAAGPRSTGEAAGLHPKQICSRTLAATFNRLTSLDHYRGRDRGTGAAIEFLRSDAMKTVDLVVTGDETAAVLPNRE